MSSGRSRGYRGQKTSGHLLVSLTLNPSCASGKCLAQAQRVQALFKILRNCVVILRRGLVASKSTPFIPFFLPSSFDKGIQACVENNYLDFHQLSSFRLATHSVVFQQQFVPRYPFDANVRQIKYSGGFCTAVVVRGQSM